MGQGRVHSHESRRTAPDSHPPRSWAQSVPRPQMARYPQYRRWSGGGRARNRRPDGTVHTLGGRAMLDAAVLAAGGELDLIGVTVLTSFDAASYARALGRTEVALPQEVERLALLAVQAGLRGVVCSPKEVSLLHRRLGPESYLVVPGIRGRAEPHEDQARVATARDAATSGATHLVVGRPVLQADDPAQALGTLLKEAECIGS